jgi:hypothetical protein
LQEDQGQEGRFINKPRVGHSMLFDDQSRQLFIFAGQRNKEHLTDFFVYNVDTNETRVLCDGVRTKVPASGFTQRATIDTLKGEIHVLAVSREASDYVHLMRLLLIHLISFSVSN